MTRATRLWTFTDDNKSISIDMLEYKTLKNGYLKTYKTEYELSFLEYDKKPIGIKNKTLEPLQEIFKKSI